ncbi:cysteine desulfurase [Patescibacteria group bacterium]|nr:cysteine desulfurase [Patescibacteria group bacterium]
MIKVLNLKSDFPIFTAYPDLVYLDSAATSQKPQIVIDAVTDFYTTKNANIHRGIYKLAEIATATYENTRNEVAKFINAGTNKEIIFTGNTNQAINLVAYGWARKFLCSGDVIVLSEMEHHANIIPWLRLKEEKGIKLIFLPINKEYRLDYLSLPPLMSLRGEHDSARRGNPVVNNKTYQIASPAESAGLAMTNRIKLIALTHASNVLGAINPLEKIIPYFKKQSPNAKILIDAAQSIPHIPIDVQALGIDFLAFSSHKILGPSGVGVLWAKEKLLEKMDPLFVGSNMIRQVTKEKATWADLPDKFEAGTANLEGVAGLASAISYINKIGYKNIIAHEQELTKYGLEKLRQIPGLKLFGQYSSKNRLGIFSFSLPGIHPHDISQILDSQNIAIRSGHHCAQITMQVLGVPATARASLYLYNTKEDIDKLAEGIKVVKKTLRI